MGLSLGQASLSPELRLALKSKEQAPGLAWRKGLFVCPSLYLPGLLSLPPLSCSGLANLLFAAVAHTCGRFQAGAGPVLTITPGALIGGSQASAPRHNWGGRFFEWGGAQTEIQQGHPLGMLDGAVTWPPRAIPFCLDETEGSVLGLPVETGPCTPLSPLCSPSPRPALLFPMT